ncbi:MAG: amino acid racemase [Thermoanaerobaculia bacterium]|nr:amino acid racemase [Thermoanaerobaculia bacterium]
MSPKILPVHSGVEWPLSEGTLGVVGVAPWATIEFCRVLYGGVRASKDWCYPRVLIDINTKIPSRGRHLQLGETDPSAAIAATIEELASQGATLAVVVCNTAHILFDGWGRSASIPVLNIIDETVSAARSHGARKVTPLVSTSLAKADLYGSAVESVGLECTRLGSEDQELVGEVIEQIKIEGQMDSIVTDRVRALLEALRLRGVDTVLGGCTELSSLGVHCQDLGLEFVDSNAALARSALAGIGVSTEGTCLDPSS